MESQEYQSAIKKLQATKPKDNYLLCNIAWDLKVVLPYKVGLALMESLGQAERLVDEYNKPPAIQPFDRDRITMSILSAKEYEQIRIAQLLKVTLDTVKEYETTNT
jgi:hypothetical protein